MRYFSSFLLIGYTCKLYLSRTTKSGNKICNFKVYERNYTVKIVYHLAYANYYRSRHGAELDVRSSTLSLSLCCVSICDIPEHLVYIFSDLLLFRRVPVRAVTDDDYVCHVSQLTR